MITTQFAAELIRGAVELESSERGARSHRLPRPIRERFADPQLTLMEAHPSGVRVAVRTTSVDISMQVHATRISYRGATRARGAVDVVVDGVFHHSHVLTGGDTIEIDPRTGTRTFESGASELVTITALAPGEKTVEIWLPHNEQIDLIALRSDAQLHPAPPSGPVWLHHGSSISQGSNATSPTRIWPVVAALRGGAQLRNLGFGGSALVDPFMARLVLVANLGTTLVANPNTARCGVRESRQHPARRPVPNRPRDVC
ncbi:hypothetical protein [Nocardia sp. NPDC023988]|uniref:hypothetical protein n=1 Tax=unclassified Nocardia TaxID=2637762 RepID=UPI003407641F